MTYVKVIGTAHFTRKSAEEIRKEIERIKPNGICLELDKERFERFKNLCLFCPEREICDRRCEFLVASEAITSENREADIWLIDMDKRDLDRRIASNVGLEERLSWGRIKRYISPSMAKGIKLWEEGLKKEAMEYFGGSLEAMKRACPTIWHVLIDERNALMGYRVRKIIENYWKEGIKDPKLIVITGAAHVNGVKSYIRNLKRALEDLKKCGIKVSDAYRIKRIPVL
jgi:pheromone shutdown protein TraB